MSDQLPLRPSFGPVEARTLTDHAKRDISSLRERLLVLYEGGAHLALGYPSWGAYWETEFETSWRTGYRELEAARVDRAIDPWDNEPAPPERQTRELVRLLRQEDEEQVLDLWLELREEHGDALTAEKVRGAVEQKLRPRQVRVELREPVDQLAQAKRVLSAAYSKAAGLIADWLEDHPDADPERVCRQISPLGWQGLLTRLEREEKP